MSDPTDPNRNPRRDFYVGVTVTLALVVLAMLVLTFGGVRAYFDGGYTVTIRLPIAQGLTEGSTATLAGVPVGTVKKVRTTVRDNGTLGVEAEVKVRNEVDLPLNTRADLKEQILGGTANIIFMVDRPPTDAQKDRLLPKDGSATIDGVRTNLALDIVGGLKGTLDGTLGGMTKKAGDTMDSIKGAADALTAAMAQQDQAKVASGELQPNLATTIVKVNSLVTHTDELVSDPKLRADLNATLAAARKAAEDGSTAIGELKAKVSGLTDKAGATLDTTSAEIQSTGAAARETMAGVRASLGELEKKYGVLADNLNATAARANAILEAVDKGEGTAGKLVRDPALYDNLQDAAQRLQAAIEDIRLLVEKLRKEGVELKVGL